MNVFLYATGFGLLGLTAMAALGLAHGHSPGQTGHGHSGHAHAPHGLHLPGHGHSAQTHGPALVKGHAPHAASAHEQGASFLPSLMILTSPRVWLSLMLGFGLIGLLLTGFALTARLPEAVLLALAGAGGVAFELWLVQPYWNALLNFQSSPAQLLDSTVQSRAQAVTDFDASGSGLISLELGGEVRQLLATLEGWDVDKGLRVRRGDPLLVQTVDERRNRCTVSSLNSAAPFPA